MFYANAEFQRGLVTPLGSDAKEVEGLQMTHVILPRIPLLWKPPPARYVILNRTHLIAHGENTKA